MNKEMYKPVMDEIFGKRCGCCRIKKDRKKTLA